MPKRVGLVVVGIAAAAAAIPLILAADDPNEGVPAFPTLRPGDAATYAGPQGIHIAVREGALTLADARVATAIEIQFVVDGAPYGSHFISPEDGTLIAASLVCPSRWDGVCAEAEAYFWNGRGLPSVFGLGLLRGPVAPGTSWTIEPPCRGCPDSFTVSVEAAMPHSPPGSAAVIRVSSSTTSSGTWLAPPGTFTYGTAHGFPLSAEVRDGVYTLREFHRGTDATWAPADLELRPVLIPVPSAGWPAEGRPMAPHPAISDARAQALGAAPRNADEVCHEILYQPFEHPLLDIPGAPPVVDYEIAETCVASGAAIIHTLRSETLGQDVDGRPLRRWTAEERPGTLPAEACQWKATVPIWDAVRVGHPLLPPMEGGFRGFQVVCAEREVRVLGDPLRDAAVSDLEVAVVDMDSGFLRYVVRSTAAP